MLFVGVDSGTTTTRAWLVEDGKVLSEARARAGARDLARAQTSVWLAGQVRSTAEQALDASGRTWAEVEAMVAFGMITSELGLEEVPHLDAPVDADRLAGAMLRRTYQEIPVPVHLVPGVRSDGEGQTAESDFMRGEETEAMGLVASHFDELPALLVSTGSHTKFVLVDDEGCIRWSFTTLSGELLWALHRETILTALIDPRREVTDFEAVEAGARAAEERGLSRALFRARLLNRLQGLDPGSCSDFLHGAVAQADLLALSSFVGDRLPEWVAITGGNGLTQTYHHLLQRGSGLSRVRIMDRPLGPLGAWRLYTASTVG